RLDRRLGGFALAAELGRAGRLPAEQGGIGERRVDLRQRLGRPGERRLGRFGAPPRGAGRDLCAGRRGRRGGGGLRRGVAHRGGGGGGDPRAVKDEAGVVVHVALEGRDGPVGREPQPVGDQLHQRAVVGDQDDRTLVLVQRLEQGAAAVD